MAYQWIIDSAYNDGYPFKSWMSGKSFDLGWTTPLPLTAWQRADGTNDGYPFKTAYPNLRSSGGSTSSSTFEVGGHQTNYPGGLTTIPTPLSSGSTSLDWWSSADTALLNAIGSCRNTLLMPATSFREMVSEIGSLWQSIASVFTGLTPYDIVIDAKLYPFALQQQTYPNTHVSFSGGIDWYVPTGVASLTAPVARESFGYVKSPITTGWEAENVSWQIYLVGAGIYPITIKNDKYYKVVLTVDTTNGMGVYTVLESDNTLVGQGIPVMEVQCKIAVDLPINTAQSAVQCNMQRWGATAFATLLKTSPYTASAGNALGTVADAVPLEKPSCESPGGALIARAYPNCCLIATLPELADNLGYNEILGKVYDSGVASLGSQTGFVKCENYKCNIIVATEDEKREIESLLNGGVFI